MVLAITYLVLCLGGQRVDVAALERELGGSCHCETIDLRDARIAEIAPGGARHAALLAAAKALNAKGTLKGVFLLPGEGDIRGRSTKEYGRAIVRTGVALGEACGHAPAWVCGKVELPAPDDPSYRFARELNDWTDYSPAASMPAGTKAECGEWRDVKVLAAKMRELTDIDLTPFGESYARLWNAEVNAAIDARIERYRKRDYEFGGFRPGETVEVEQVSHEFGFGANFFNFEQFGDDRENAAYREIFGTFLNAATVGFYWSGMEPEEGRVRYRAAKEDLADYWKAWKREKGSLPVFETPGCPNEWRRPAPDYAIDYLQGRGVDVYGHLVIYPGSLPKWLGCRYDEATVGRYLRRRIWDIASHYGARVPHFEITNESVDPGDRGEPTDKKFPGLSNLPDDYNFMCFAEAKRAFPPSVDLAFNNAYRPYYVDFAKKMIARGAKIDLLGLQMHIFSESTALKIAAGFPGVTDTNGVHWQPERQIEMLRKADETGAKLHISEITVPAPRSLLPREEADRVQARILRDNYRLWFSWPSMTRITYWNLVDGVGAEILASGFYNRDLSPKPAAIALNDLINREWKTRLTLVADASGRIRFRGFKGRYRLNGNPLGPSKRR